MKDWLGKTLGKVRLEKLIARGGMAEVYYGMHTTLDRPVAVKVMLSFLEDDPDLKTRFGREARVLASLRHPNIVQIFDFDVADGQPYFVMEYLDGPTLADHLRTVHATGKLFSLPQIGRIMVMLASALDYAHAQGVIHRDIKPGNMILHSKATPVIPGMELTEGVEIILTDFGLLRLTDSTSHSVSGTIAGTPAYISPEQARGDKVDHRTDLYSLGVVLYEMLAGRVPFESESSMGILMKHISETPTPIPGLPVALQNVLDRALAKKPADRYNSGRELARAFLEATSLSESEVAPGHRLTPPPTSLSDVTLPPDKNATVLSKPKIATTQPRFQPWLLAIPVTLLALVIVAIFFLVTRLSTTASPQPSATPAAPKLEPTQALITLEPAPEAQASATPSAEMSMSTPSGSASGDLKKFGLLRFYDLSGILDEAILTSDGLPPAPAGSQYEAWLVGGEARRSLGVFAPDDSGKAELTFLDEKSRNLLTLYEGLEITLEDNPDQSPNPSGKVVYSSGLPPQALSHIRHVLVAFGGAPNDTGLMVGLIADVSLLETNAAALVAANDKKNAAGVRKNAEAIFNLLVGSQGKGYGDLDKDGKVTDPGDEYGLFLNGDNAGYLEGTLQHAQLAMQMPDATENIQLHGEHVGIVVKNIEEWATELFPLLTQVLDNPLGPDSAKQAREIAALIDRIRQGRDLNGNEKIEPVPGEGGVETALEHAGYMTDMPILEGAEQLPPPIVK